LHAAAQFLGLAAAGFTVEAPDLRGPGRPGRFTRFLHHRDRSNQFAQTLERGLAIRYRQGGEEIKLLDQSHTKKLKKLFQEEGVVPWMRERLPLVYSGDELCAVGDLWMASAAVSQPGTALIWKNRPPIH